VTGEAVYTRCVFITGFIPTTLKGGQIFELKIKLMKGKALRKHSLHEKTAASVLLKLFISRKDQSVSQIGFSQFSNTSTETQN